MKVEEAFRVAAIPAMASATDQATIKALERAKSMITAILGPLRLGSRLTFSLHEDSSGLGWVLVRIRRSGQLSLFDEFSSAIESARQEAGDAANAAQLFNDYLTELRRVMQQFRISGFELESLAQRLPELLRLKSTFGIPCQDSVRVSVDRGADSVEDFVLSPLPKRHIHPQRQAICFLAEKVGARCAEIRLDRESLLALDARRSLMILRWDPKNTQSSLAQLFFDRMLSGTPTHASVRVILGVRGSVLELLLDEIDLVDLGSAAT